MAARLQRQYAPRSFDADLDGGTAFDVARQLDRFTQRFDQGVDPMLADQDANRIRSTIAEGGDVTPSLGLTWLQQQRNAVAQEAHLSRAVVSLSERATELEREFPGNTIEEADNFALRLDEAAKPIIAKVPEEFQGAAMQRFDAERGRLVGDLKEKAYRREDERNLQDIAAANEVDIDKAMRFARDGNDEALAEITTNIAGRYSRLVEKGIVGPEAAKAKGLELADKALGQMLLGQVMRGGGPSLEEVESGKGAAAGLSIPTRDALAGHIRSAQAHARAEASAARSAAKAGVRANSQMATAAARDLEAGVYRDEGYLNQVDALLKTPGALSPAAHEKLLVARETYGLARTVATMSREEIEVEAAKRHAAPILSAADKRIRERELAAYAERERRLQEDPTGYATEVLPQVVPPVVLPSDPNAPGFDAGLAQAAQNVNFIDAHFDVRANPLSKPQQAQLATTMATASAQEKAVIRGKIEKAFGPRASLIHESLAKEGAQVEAFAGTLAAQGAESLAQSLETGADLLKANAVKQPSEDEASRALFSASIPAAFPTNVNAQSQILRSATARAAHLAMLAGQPDNTASFMGQALKELAPTGRFGTSTIALPLGVTPTQFADRMASMTDTELDEMAGRPGGLGEVADSIRNQRVRLESIGEGRYFVTRGTDRVKLPDGRPLVLDWNGVSRKPDEQRRDGLILEELPPEGFNPSGR